MAKTNWRYIAGVATGIFVVEIVVGVVGGLAAAVLMPGVFNRTKNAARHAYYGWMAPY